VRTPPLATRGAGRRRRRACARRRALEREDDEDDEDNADEDNADEDEARDGDGDGGDERGVREEGADIADDARDGVLDLAELSALPDADAFDLLADHDDEAAGVDTGDDDLHAGASALLDAEHTPGGAVTGDDASFAAAAAGADETYEAWLRRRQPSRWGRFDVRVAVRRRDNAPAHAPAYQTGELWLVATWRR